MFILRHLSFSMNNCFKTLKIIKCQISFSQFLRKINLIFYFLKSVSTNLADFDSPPRYVVINTFLTIAITSRNGYPIDFNGSPNAQFEYSSILQNIERAGCSPILCTEGKNTLSVNYCSFVDNSGLKLFWCSSPRMFTFYSITESNCSFAGIPSENVVYVATKSCSKHTK